MKKTAFLLGLVFSLSIINCQLSIAQCAMCKSTVESNQKIEVTNRAKGLNTGILYLMVIPYVLIGGLGYLWYKNGRKEKEDRDKIDAVVKRAIS